MRSLDEIVFRAGQELANLRMWARAPERPRYPAPAGPSRSRRADHLADLPERILRHKFPLLGYEIDTGPEIRWRRDYVHGIESGLEYFRRVPYLDFSRTGDHKIVWELNRHQHLVVLAQAFALRGADDFAREIWLELRSWIAENPFLRGINWTSALEVGFRALSWMWVWRLCGHAMPDELRGPFLDSLYRHGCYLEHNLSVYFSPNTHLLGEAVAVHALGTAFPEFDPERRWRDLGRRITREQICVQVREDGSHFEQSTYYHLYALDFFLLHAILEPAPPDYLDRLGRMAEYLDALLGPSGNLPFLGDDDGGRVFHPYGPRERFGRATLATASALLGRPEWLRDPADLQEQAAWWLELPAEAPASRRSAPRSRVFHDAGLAILESERARVLFDAGPFGTGSGGHSHADALAIVVERDGRPFLIDPGTFTYISSPERRDWFRGTAAHNTVRIDGLDQAAPAGPFRWIERPGVTLHSARFEDTRDFVDAECRYRGFVHRRRLLFLKPELLFVLDEISGPEGPHEIEQLWHFVGDHEGRLTLSAPVREETGWVSPVFGVQTEAPVLRIFARTTLPLVLGAAIDLAREPMPGRLEIEPAPDGWRTLFQGRREYTILWDSAEVMEPAGSGVSAGTVSHTNPDGRVPQ